MPRNKDFKKRVRRRMSETGERYTEARKKLGGKSEREGLPVRGWLLTGSHPNDYEIGLENAQTFEGHRVAYLRSVATRASGFGTIMQTISADEFVGKRVRFSATVRGEGIDSWAGLWMRIDGPGGTMPLAFDNMESRPLKGSFDWSDAEVILDVAPEAQAIAFGALLAGPGVLQLARLGFEEIHRSVPVTHVERPKRPRNIDFSDVA